MREGEGEKRFYKIMHQFNIIICCTLQKHGNMLIPNIPSNGGGIHAWLKLRLDIHSTVQRYVNWRTGVEGA